MIKKLFYVAVAVGVVIVAVVAVRAFLFSPAERVKVVAIADGVHDPAEWGKHYPLEYQSYLKNREMAPSPTGFGGLHITASQKYYDDKK